MVPPTGFEPVIFRVKGGRLSHSTKVEYIYLMVLETGIEPATLRLQGVCSAELSYSSIYGRHTEARTQNLQLERLTC